MKPEFDKRVEPYLDQNMKMNMEKIRKIKKEARTRDDRHRKIQEMRDQRRISKEKVREKEMRVQMLKTSKKKWKGRGKTPKRGRKTKKKNLDKEVSF